MSAKNLVIVESPAKAKTISKFLGSKYKVLASFGHVRDLPKSDMGVDIEKDFEPKYVTSKDKFHTKAVKEIKSAYDPKTTEIFIATDEDREGEAIGWHLLHILKVKEKDIQKTKRIVFHEITKPAITSAIENPVNLNFNLVDAQQARRVLDRLVGYELSPLLWKKIRYGLSAGRVQSVAVRLVVEKEEEIKAFTEEEYWTIDGLFENTKKQAFEAKLLQFKGKKLPIPDEKTAQHIEKDLANAVYSITEIRSKDTKRNPAPPFTTSTLQQEASRKLGFSVKKTMQIAQQLYEGVDVGHGTEGLITYMRTDSVNLSTLALNQCKEVISKEFGKEYSLEKPRYYKKKKGAQEAHEAIRPVNISYLPEKISSSLSLDQLKLYTLIWKRTLACQMKEAKLKNTSVDIEANNYLFRATGQQIMFPGFMKVYIEDTDNEQDKEQNNENILPPLEEGEAVTCQKLEKKQHFTKPPARYTEASLVKKLEELGIGRPSTYAPTLSTIQTRGYVTLEKKQFIPTDTAFVVTKFLKEHFTNIVDYPFTADMEQKLDDIAEGNLKWKTMLKDFYTGFHSNIEKKEKEVDKSSVTSEKIGRECPECGQDLVKKLSRFGMFISCSGYPDCKYSEKMNQDDLPEPRELGKCPDTKKPIYAMVGRYGPYVKRGELDAPKKETKMASIIAPYDLESIDLEGACKLLSLPRLLGADDGIEIFSNNGRYGPYVQKDKEYRSIPKDKNVFDITLQEALELLKQPKPSRKPQELKKLGKKGKKEIVIKNGRYGAYITDGKVNAKLPKGKSLEEITLEEALQVLEEKKKK